MTNPGIFVPFYGLSLMSKLMSVMSRVNDTDVPNNGISLMSNLMSVMSNVNAADIPKTGPADHLIFVYCSSEAI